MTIFLLGAALTGCQTEPPPPPDPLDVSWIATVVREPDRFASTLENNGGREAWQAFHRGDWLNVRGNGSSPEASAVERRANAELAVLERTLQVAQGDALLTLADGWAGHTPDQPVPKWLIAGAQRVAELRSEAAVADRWRAEAASAAIVFDDANPKPWAVDQPADVDVDALRAPAGAIQANTLLGAFWDPTRPAALEQRYRQNASLALGVGLPEDLFGPIVEAAMGTRPANDDEDACRAFAVAMDGRLDAWSTHLGDEATPDGKALLADLQLIRVGRSRTLSTLAVDALQKKHDRCALFYAEQALDHAAARQISPINSPTIYAVIAAANVRLGHVREALDALAPLRSAFPESIGVSETIGDLAVQQGLERTGLSREN